MLSQSEVQDLLNALDNIKHKAILMTIYAAGLRVSEVANLRLTDIDSRKMQIYVSLAKGKKDRYCILSKKNLEVLRNYFEEYKPKDWLFPNKNTGKPISVRTIQRIFDKARDKAGIKKNATVHTLRHYVESNIMGSE